MKYLLKLTYYKINIPLIFLILGIIFFTSCSQPEPIITKTIEDSLDLTQSFTPISASVLVTGEEQLSRKIETVRVLPSHIVLKQNEQIELTAEAIDDEGIVIEEGVNFIWTSLDPRVGIVNKNGIFKASHIAGTYPMGIQVTGISNKSSIRPVGTRVAVTILGSIKERTLESLLVYPQNPSLLSKQVYKLRAIATDKNGLVIPDADIIWSLNSKKLGHINKIGYLTVEGDSGFYKDAITITANWNSKSISVNASVTVTDLNPLAELLTVHALPQRFFVDPGDRLYIRAVALNGLGEIAAGTQLRWAMNNTSAGNIDGTGNFIASKTPGIYTQAIKVEAVISGEQGFITATDYASVVIRDLPSPRTLSAIYPWPYKVTVTPNGLVNLSIRAYDQFGDPIPLDNIEWSIENDAIGTITENRLFRASSTPGKYPNAIKIIGKQEMKSDIIQISEYLDVTITGKLNKLEIYPNTAILNPGDTVHFSISGWDENNVELSNLVTRWSPVNEDIGKIDAYGNFTAGTSPGLFEDIVKAKVYQISSSQ